MRSSDAESDDGPDDSTDRSGIDTATRGAEPSVLADPYLLAGGAGKRLLAALNRAYARFEDLPGWARIGFGTSLFLLSIYYGRPIKGMLDHAVAVLVTTVVGAFGKLSLGVRIVLLLLVFVSLQTLSVNRRLAALSDRVEEGFNRVADEADGNMGQIDDIASGGGALPADESDTERVDSSRTGVLVGGVAGAALGAQFGLVPIVGGAIMGAIVGDEVEKFSVRRRRRDR